MLPRSTIRDRAAFSARSIETLDGAVSVVRGHIGAFQGCRMWCLACIPAW
jgi:hypothetical protein